ncbi:hypothetical protein FSARC_595 [Fusarium sarcochroum]|uniref:Velvet domain-containing protein n=1 Tax=Fusarium sarcochroum TaxID=1208366 RepID=A0A8H4UAS2_9HYPO|nr:hypothetical protein FSARC_595 [Fusarium sarcochroum]
MQSIDGTKPICEGKGHNSDSGHAVTADYERKLMVLQQPVAAAQSNGVHDKNGVAIDPCPIVELTFNGIHEAWRCGCNELYTSKYVMHCSLSQGSDKGKGFSSPDFRQQELLGPLCSDPFRFEDGSGGVRYFFCFPGVFCRVPGLFRLRFTLAEFDSSSADETESVGLSTVDSQCFRVSMTGDFPGAQETTAWTKCLERQGYDFSQRADSGAAAVVRAATRGLS